MKKEHALMIGLVLALICPCVLGQFCEDWVFRKPNPQGNRIEAMTHDGFEFWAVGKFGLVMSSPDGHTWFVHASGEPEQFIGIVHSSEGFTVLSESGAIQTSADGEMWTQAAFLSPPIRMRGLAYGGGLFVAVGPRNTSYSSVNRTDWTQCDTNTSSVLYDVAYDGTQFIAVGENATICTSSDGCTWTAVEQVNGVIHGLYGVDVVNGLVVAVGDSGVVLTSTDLITWSSVPTPDSYRLHGSFFWDNKYFVFGSRVYESPTATSWSQCHAFDGAMMAGACSDSQMVVGGEGGQINTSFDGVSWNQENQLVSRTLYGLAYGAGRFVTTTSNSGKILTSMDGVDWSETTTGASIFSTDVAFLDGEFLAVGQQGKIATSLDGLAWNEQTTPTGSHLRAIGFDGSTAVVVGDDGVILYSSDLVTWTKADLGPVYNYFLGVTCGNDGSGNRFLATGSNGIILHSPDGQVWTPATSSSLVTYNLNDVLAVGTQYVAVGANGVILTSEFGDVWVQQNSGTSQILRHVLHDGKRFRVFGSGQSALYSLDAETWTSAYVPVWPYIFSSVQVGQKIFCGATEGAIIEVVRQTISCADWMTPLNVMDLVTEVNDCGF